MKNAVLRLLYHILKIGFGYPQKRGRLLLFRVKRILCVLSSERRRILRQIFARCTADAFMEDTVEAGDAAKSCG